MISVRYTAAMHGEYKTPGGKLVVVDFAIRGGRIAAMVVSGDFFLYPEDAISVINAALDGLPADTPEGEIAARIAAAVGPDVTFLGFSPEAIAAAIGRAMSNEQ